MNYEGTVTAINHHLFCFELDSNVSVFFGCNRKRRQLLPICGDQIKITNAHFSAKKNKVEIIILCDNSNEGGIIPSIANESDKQLHKFIQELKLGVADFIEINEMSRSLFQNFTNFDSTVTVQIFSSVLYIMLKEHRKIENESCYNQILKKFTILTPIYCKYIDKMSDIFTDFPYFSFGNHSKKNSTQYLIGFLEIDESLGLLNLKDSNFSLPCIFIGIKNYSSIINHFILVQNYKIITEIYKESDVPNLNYIIINFKFVQVLLECNKQKYISMVQQENMISKTYLTNKVFVQILKKSLISTAKDGKSEFWLHVIVYENEFNLEHDTREAFLCLNHKYVRNYSDLCIGKFYWVLQKGPWIEENFIEIKRLNASIPQYQITNAIFISRSKPTLKNHSFEELILDVKTVKEFISKNSAPEETSISFKGVVKFRKFNDSLSSRTSKKQTNPLSGFGTLGSKTHFIEFAVEEDDVKTLTLYLNNWENLLTPLGLLPNMEVIVRNASIKKGKMYCKSNIFTCIEIVDYRPLTDFETCSLLNEDFQYNWGSPYFLGLGNLIPGGVLIWGRVTMMAIDSLKFVSMCAYCDGTTFMGDGNCRNCHMNVRKRDVSVIVSTFDEFGQSKVMAKSFKILKCLLKIQNQQMWFEALDSIQNYQFSRNSTKFFNCRPSNDNIEHTLRYCITRSLLAINAVGICKLELKCRKLDSALGANDGRPFWFCTDARRYLV